MSPGDALRVLPGRRARLALTAPASWGAATAQEAQDRITLTILAWLALALSTLVESYVTWVLYDARGFVSCPPSPPPVADRLRLVYGGLGFRLVLAISALVLLVRARKLGTGIAFGLACVSVLVPIVEFFVQIFAIGMC